MKNIKIVKKLTINTPSGISESEGSGRGASLGHGSGSLHTHKGYLVFMNGDTRGNGGMFTADPNTFGEYKYI